jgi:RNA polymerase sigma factor (sigma-70 family)
MTENEIIRQILSGDTQQYSRLVNSYSKMCYSVAFRIIQDADEAQDIVQEAFISAFEHLASFKGDAKFSTWLYRIVMNKAVAVKNKTKYFDEVDNQPIANEEYDLDMESHSLKELKKALAILNEKERLIIELFYYQEQSIKEISTICNVSEVNVKVLLHRARKKMNELMTKNAKFASND